MNAAKLNHAERLGRTVPPLYWSRLLSVQRGLVERSGGAGPFQRIFWCGVTARLRFSNKPEKSKFHVHALAMDAHTSFS